MNSLFLKQHREFTTTSKCQSVTEFIYCEYTGRLVFVLFPILSRCDQRIMPKNRNRNIQGNERPKSSDVQFSSVKDLGVGKKRSRADLSESDTSMANSTVHSTLADNDYDHDLNKLDTLLQSLSKNENATKKNCVDYP